MQQFFIGEYMKLKLIKLTKEYEVKLGEMID